MPYLQYCAHIFTDYHGGNDQGKFGVNLITTFLNKRTPSKWFQNYSCRNKNIFTPRIVLKYAAKCKLRKTELLKLVFFVEGF